MPYDVYISHSRKDTDIVDSICEAFDNVCITYFIARQDSSIEMEFSKALSTAIQNCKVFLLLASEKAYQSPVALREFLFALIKKHREERFTYIIDDKSLPEEFASVTDRLSLREHPIEPVLVDNVLRRLGRARPRYNREELNELFSRAEEYYKEGRYTLALRWYNEAAEQGYAPAMDGLGIMYSTGKGVEKNYSEALRWWRKAAEQGLGYAPAMNRIGGLYRSGHGVPRDEVKAMQWFHKAAEQGYGHASYNIGFAYLAGIGNIHSDYAEAVRWFRKASEEGHGTAQYYLGLMYEKGEGVPQDKAEARRWLQKSAEQGNEDAKKELQNLLNKNSIII